MKNRIPVRIEAIGDEGRHALGHKVRVFNPKTGEIIGGVRKADIRMSLGEIVTANIEFMPEGIDVTAMVDRAVLRIKRAELQHKIIMIDEMLR